MMLSLAHFIALFLLVSFPVSDSVSGPHITDVNLLLPPHMTYPVEYRLQGTDGCFSWSWDHHDILSLQPEFNNSSSRCSTSARLKSIAPYDGRKETAVYAADLRTGIVIRCKVFIDKISRIQIFHNSIKLDLGGLATLRARAFDSQENVFSSLVGLQFLWMLMPESDGGIHHLVHVPLKESPLSDCGGFCGDLDTQIKLEDSGVFSDLYAVRGTEIGHEIVTVNLIEPQFEHMTDKIVLTVAEAMSIDPPSPVFVIIGATVHYSLKVIRQHTPQAIDLPSTYHQWSVLNSSVAVVDYMMGVAQSLNLGTTTITVEDTRVVGHVQMSSLHVVLPDTLCLYKLPVTNFGDPIEGIKVTPSTNRWYVVAGQQYVIYVKVFTRGPGGQEIYITESDDVMLQYDESAYWITTSTPVNIAVKHGWHRSRILKATSQGLGRLTASLTYPSGHPEKIEVLQVAQEVMVCDHVKFSMAKSNDSSQSIHLPWAPGVHQELELTATGGCVKTSNGYKWYSSDAATVFVSASGVVQAKRPGQATIKVVSTFDSMNYDEVVIQVSVPSSMVMLPNFAVEAVVGTYLQAAVTMKASNGSYFYRCDSFSSYIRWTAGSESFKIVDKAAEASALNTLPNIEEYHLHYGPPCAWTFIYASSAGRALLHATLSKELQSFDHPPDGPKVLKASSIIASYHPLVVRQAGNGNQFGGYVVDFPTADVIIQLKNLDDLYLVPQTEMDVKLIGGPDRWDQGVEFVEDVNIFDEEHRPLHDGILVDRTFSSGGLYRISCQTLGIYRLVFSRGNLVGDDHPLPAIEKVELSLTCSFPSSITLIANEPVNTPELVRSAAQADRSPGRIRATPITVANGCTIRTAAVSLHRSGKAFANSSSLSLKWELSSCDGLAYWDANVLERSSSSWERFLVLKNASGLCIVRATVSGFSATMTGHLYKRASSLLEKSEHILTDAIRLQLVSSMRIVPESILLFFSPDAKVTLSITGGTCFLDAVVNDTQVVEVIQLPSSLQCSHLMLGPRGLGTAVVTVHDIGLAPPITASAVVQVADMDWIKIISQEEISLMEGSLLSIDILAGVRDGGVFDSSQYVYMNVHVHIEDPILEFDNTDASSTGNTYISEPSFTIRAKKLGVTTLYVSAKQRSGHEVLSQPIKVEVYAPPRVHPDDIFLVPGASYGLTLKGGPTIGVFVEYASMDDGTAAIDRSSGRLSAISPGNTTVLAIVYGKGNIVICQAHGSIKVGIPSSMILNLQSEQLSVGREMPIFPSLVEGNLFSFYELCQNYKWTVEDEQVLSFQRLKHLDEVPFSGAKETKALTYLDGKDLGFINIVYGRSAGRTNVAVSFSCDFISGTFSLSRSYNASVSLWVVSDPPLSLGVPITWVLPPFYTTSDVLPSSSDVHNKWHSSSRKGTIVYSLLRCCGGKNEEIQQDVISINGGRITTGDSDNLACIQAKDRISGRTEIASCVRVAEVAQIRLTTKEFPFHVADLAVGAELELLINYCDSLGNPFYEAYDVVQIDAVTNYPEVVSINGSRDGFAKFHLKAMRQGRALVQITMNNNPQKSDYMMISVGAHLYPQNPVLHVGRYLNFTVGGLDGLVFGRWLSANGSVLSIDKLSGEAYASAEGATQVMFEGSSLKLQTTITVLRVGDVLVDSPAETLTNVLLPTKGYNFSIRFSDPSGNKFEAIGSSKGVLYDCMVDPPFVGYTKPWRDHDTGNSYCLFFPFSPKHLARKLSKSKATRSDIFVTISASLREAGSATGSSSALFIGGFSVLEMDKNLMQLNLTPDSNSSIITVVGNTDVVIHWKERDLMMVSPTRRDGFGLGGNAEYEVKALRAERFTDKVIITLPATGQRAEVDVSYDPGVIPSSSTSFTLWGILLACLLFISTVIIFIWFLSSPVMSTPSTPATTNITGPVTPDRGTPPPGHNIQHSPRTPQPYIEYMRRTIDETPYYKRDGRRRINPQNTY